MILFIFLINNYVIQRNEKYQFATTNKIPCEFPVKKD